MRIRLAYYGGILIIGLGIVDSAFRAFELFGELRNYPDEVGVALWILVRIVAPAALIVVCFLFVRKYERLIANTEADVDEAAALNEQANELVDELKRDQDDLAKDVARWSALAWWRKLHWQ